jgi:4-amino-4-deoxy-L-arabinose transferase-like glycosyltransferase
MKGRFDQRLAGRAIIVAFLFLAALYNAMNPAWEAPDEVAHLGFAVHLARNHSLPEPDRADLGETHQPPLYYALVAVAIAGVDLEDRSGHFRVNRAVRWAGQGGTSVNAALHSSDETFPWTGEALALHLARAVSMLFGAATVALTMALARAIFGSRGAVPPLAGALVAFNPQFLFLHGAVSNETLLSTLYAGSLLALLAAFREPAATWRWAAVALLSSAALLTKISAITLVPVSGLALALSTRRVSLRAILRSAAIMAAIVAAVFGWWLLRNQLLLGDPLGFSLLHDALRPFARVEPLRPGDLVEFVTTQFRSFWGVFGWMTVPAPRWFHAMLAASTAAAVVGLGRVIAGRANLEIPRERRAALLLLGAAIAFQEAFLLAAIRTFDASWYQGRYLFPVVAPVAVFLAIGLLGLVPSAFRAATGFAVAVALAVPAVAFPFYVIAPAYDSGVVSKWRQSAIPNPSETMLGESFALRGHASARAPERGQLVLTLYWGAHRRSATDPQVEVEILNGEGRTLASETRVPGDAERYPPRAWLPGDVVADRWTFVVPPESEARHARIRLCAEGDGGCKGATAATAQLDLDESL